METVLEQVGIKHGQPFVYASLPPEVKSALEVATKQVQQEFAKTTENPAAIGGLKNGWVIPSPETGNFGTNYRLRAAIAFVGFGANLTADALYPLLVQDSNGKVLDGGKKYKITFPKGEYPPPVRFGL
jgi:hypothetical protein